MHAPDTKPPLVDYEPQAPPGVSPNYKWWVVVMLWFICFLNNADRQAISSIFPILKSDYGFTKVQLGLISSAFMWVYAFNSPIAGYIGDRARRKDLIFGGCAFWSIIAATTGFCSKLWQFITVRALEGFGETFYFPASMSLISDYHGRETRSKAMSFHQSSVYIGNIAGAWLTALIAKHYGWRIGFYLFGALGVILSLVLFRFIREPRRGQLERSQTSTQPLTIRQVGTAFYKPSVILLFLTFFGANFVTQVFVAWTTTFLVEKHKMDIAAAALFGTLFIYLAGAVGSPFGGIMADRFSRRLPGGRMIVQAIGLLFGSVFVFLVGTTESKVTLLTAMTFFGFGKGMYDSNIFASLYEAIEPRARATGAGLMNTIGWCGGALGPVSVGFFAQYGRGTQTENMSRAIAATSGIYVIGALLLLSVALVFIKRDSLEASGSSRFS
jgi:MFS family permease